MENTKPWFIAMILLIFTAGIFAGILLDKKFFTPPGAPRMDEPPMREFGEPGGPEFGKDRHRQHFVDMLTQVLDLSEDQQKQVDAIMEKNEPDMLALRNDMQERMQEFHSRVTTEISEVLDEKQRTKFQKMNEQMQKRLKQDPPMPFPGKGPGMGGRPGPPHKNPESKNPKPQD